MQNIFSAAQNIAKEGVFYQGMGEAKLAMLDVRDIADTAVKVLLDPSYAGKTYTLTGPESISWFTATKAFSAALGRPVKCIPVRPENVAESIRKNGLG